MKQRFNGRCGVEPHAHRVYNTWLQYLSTPNDRRVVVATLRYYENNPLMKSSVIGSGLFFIYEGKAVSVVFQSACTDSPV